MNYSKKLNCSPKLNGLLYSMYNFQSSFNREANKTLVRGCIVNLAMPQGNKVCFFCSQLQLSMKFILHINIKIPLIVDIITLVSRINDWLWSFKHEILVDLLQYL